jgi:hypothetical protein
MGDSPMKKLTCSVFLTLALTAAPSAHAQTTEQSISAYKHRDYPTALAGFKKLADQGNADAQYILGVMYERGKGVLKGFQMRNSTWPQCMQRAGVCPKTTNRRWRGTAKLPSRGMLRLSSVWAKCMTVTKACPRAHGSPRLGTERRSSRGCPCAIQIGRDVFTGPGGAQKQPAGSGVVPQSGRAGSCQSAVELGRDACQRAGRAPGQENGLFLVVAGQCTRGRTCYKKARPYRAKPVTKATCGCPSLFAYLASKNPVKVSFGLFAAVLDEWHWALPCPAADCRMRY